jgi:tetratricopeptide (TPR) repeat protein
MANVELHRRFFGEGLVGTVDVAPTLSWSEHRALLATSEHLRSARTTIENLGLDVRSVTRALDGLEDELGLRLDQQSILLDRQVDLLADIAQSLRTPARVRAAERLAAVGELLRRKRFKRAAAFAKDAIDDDPNNPAAFLAAGWAHIGLEQLNEARAHFAEAAEASDGDQRSAATRQSARLALALDGAATALATLDDNTRRDAGEKELSAVAYDRSVYLAEMGRIDEAAESLRRAGEHEPSFLFAALTDPVLASHSEITAIATYELTTRLHGVSTQTAEADSLLDQLGALVGRLEDADRTLGANGREQRRATVVDLRATLKSLGADRDAFVKQSADELDLGVLQATLNRLRTCLSEAETYERSHLAAALSASDLERKVLDFAMAEDAWPTKQPDGTWEIRKKPRFGHERKWHGRLDEHGLPTITQES